MSKASNACYEDEYQKAFLKAFEKMSYKHSPWEVWSDFIYMSAISISNCVDTSNRENREKTYQSIIRKYSEEEFATLASMLSTLVQALEANPNQDFLGQIYMNQKFGNIKAGQFFTPYHICRFMAKTVVGSTENKIKEQGWSSVNDPTCGAGGLLIAYANECLAQHVNFQTSVLFVGQDIDPIVGLMCYLQLSILGCPGYVIIGDSLLEPPQAHGGSPLLPVISDRVWITPMFCRQEWAIRRMAVQLESEESKPGEGEVEVDR